MSNLGFGLGLRQPHYTDILETRPDVGWFEIISENYMEAGGQPLSILDRVREDYPIVMHGVSMSIGGSDPLNEDYLQKIKDLIARIEPEWYSDHLCWTGLNGTNMHDLLPLPYTVEAVNHVAERISRVQDFIGRRLTLENVSSYVSYDCSEMAEWEFLAEVTDRADCDILLDVNNVYVSAYNHEFDARAYIDAVPASRVRQIHLAGHDNNGTHIIDTHDHPVCEDVWDLYEYTVGKLGAVPTMIERDANIPPLPELLAELDRARKIEAAVLAKQAGENAA
ncbi:MAG: DUF692 domain-containing protein [Rhodospirillaceae bacterium]|nr:DUF692 domain-containing protein [Rhodospirillaceae bacterium]MBT4220033.1 DUF692 domain-containing protein [Rhodospirillaceae bacterium]MBT5013357.1 DUF692 domain-containing protein [Rhodospirillaceae bacterium]MBT5307755.1 DUF692 domain-containing protein [Rhodospirillaceae bacterium]MBT6407091.1 DUF692 domain-containing protein [Rhodospirillaceae bacterium]